jgi:hypothetical protein
MKEMKPVKLLRLQDQRVLTLKKNKNTLRRREKDIMLTFWVVIKEEVLKFMIFRYI